MSMPTPFDLALISMILVSGAFASVRGGIREALEIGPWIGSAAAAIFGFALISPLIGRLLPLAGAAGIVAALMLFVICALVLVVGSRMVLERLPAAAPGWFDRLLGFGYGLARGVVLLGIAYLMIGALRDPARWPSWAQDSQVVRVVAAGTRWAVERLPPELTASLARLIPL